MAPFSCIVIGGGAAGFFGAIALAERGQKVLLLEKHRKVLSKVKVSGGGRCNVTHACFDPKQLTQGYPRGSKELLGPFFRFGPTQTVEWFEKRGVPLKKEEDGRMFPMTNDSQTIIDCLQNASQSGGVRLQLESGVAEIVRKEEGFTVVLDSGEALDTFSLLIATGSSSKIWKILEDLGHTVVPAVPSLFTFNVPDSPFLDLSGIALDKVKVSLESGKSQEGALLLTHWGFSGPAVLKLSAWAALELHEKNYYTPFFIDFVSDLTYEQLDAKFEHKRKISGHGVIRHDLLLDFPRRLWERFLELSGINLTSVWAHLSKNKKTALMECLKKHSFLIQGKTTNKEEFVTCGGVALQEVDFQTMQSKKIPGLFFAGEVLNIDGITGGFNFQAAWTTSWVAGQSS